MRQSEWPFKRAWVMCTRDGRPQACKMDGNSVHVHPLVCSSPDMSPGMLVPSCVACLHAGRCGWRSRRADRRRVRVSACARRAAATGSRNTARIYKWRRNGAGDAPRTPPPHARGSDTWRAVLRTAYRCYALAAVRAHPRLRLHLVPEHARVRGGGHGGAARTRRGQRVALAARERQPGGAPEGERWRPSSNLRLTSMVARSRHAGAGRARAPPCKCHASRRRCHAHAARVASAGLSVTSAVDAQHPMPKVL